MLTYLDSNYNTIQFNKLDRVLISSWKVHPTTEEFREGMNFLLAAIRQFGTGKVIFDLTMLDGKKTILETDKEWLAFNWYDRALEAGYSCVAVAMPSDFFSQKSVTDLTSLIEMKVPTIYLDNLREALEWIRQFEYEKDKPLVFWINSKLERTNKYVAAFNRHLEELMAERTIEIEQFNKKLLSYNLFHYNKMKEPLIKIMEITNIIKASSQGKNDVDHQFGDFINALYESGLELDKMVREISELWKEENRHWEEKYGKMPYAIFRK